LNNALFYKKTPSIRSDKTPHKSNALIINGDISAYDNRSNMENN
jgi:hypothetical protein